MASLSFWKFKGWMSQWGWCSNNGIKWGSMAFILTPQCFSTSSLVFGPVIIHPRKYYTPRLSKVKKKCGTDLFILLFLLWLAAPWPRNLIRLSIFSAASSTNRYLPFNCPLPACTYSGRWTVFRIISHSPSGIASFIHSLYLPSRSFFVKPKFM